MRKLLYLKLAATNIQKNGKLYVPYMITCMVTVMMYFVMWNITENSATGDGSVNSVLEMTLQVVSVFAVIFLFYTNSFLIKRRKKELGMYHILGLEKRHIAHILTYEAVITGGVGLMGGLLSGVILSRLLFYLFLKVLRYDTGYQFELTVQPFLYTVLLFAVIFF